jgi:probable F420-dependent oxidoreductase
VKISIGLPQTGALATAQAVAATVDLAERSGVHGVWVVDRLLAPVAPRDPYPASPDGVLSPQFVRTLDPLQVLAAAAARSARVRIGTNVLVMPWYNPVMLARTLASLQVLSGDRLEVGLGLGWSRDELQAAGAGPGAATAGRTDEFVAVLRRVLAGGTVAFAGEHVTVPASRFELVAAPPPLYFAAYTASAMRRVARVGDGWLPAGLPFEAMTAMWTAIRQQATDVGRDASELRLVVRMNKTTLGRVVGPRTAPFEGDLAQTAEDIHRCAELGVDEVIVDLQFTECASSLGAFTGAVEALLGRVTEHLARPVTA